MVTREGNREHPPRLRDVKHSPSSSTTGDRVTGAPVPQAGFSGRAGQGADVLSPFRRWLLEGHARETAGAHAKSHGQAAVAQEVQAAVDRLNASLPSFEAIKKISILTSDFSQEAGELTPTLKVKRKVVTERQKELLDSLYA